MTIRSELEAPLAAYAQANNIPVAYEGIAFTPPTNSPYLRVFFVAKNVSIATVAANRKRTRGYLQIDVCCPDGKGSKQVEDLAEAVAALYPPANKQAFPTVSIEDYPDIGKAMLEPNFRVLPVTISYRQES